MSSASANCCQLIPRDRATVFPTYSSRQRLSLLLVGYIHPNRGPATQYPCAVCTSNVTSRGVSFKCNQCFGWVHLKCSGLQNAAQYRRTKDWACSSCNSSPAQPPPPTTAINDEYFTILQWNTNRTGNKINELGIFMEMHKVKVAVIQESKLSRTSSTPCIQNYTTVKKDRRLGQGGGLLTFVHKSINFSRKPESPETLGDPQLEELSIPARLGNIDLIISSIYIPPTSSCTGGYQPSLDHLMMTMDTLLLGDFNAQYSSWHSSLTDTRGTNLENTINGTNFDILNWDTPTRLLSNATPSSPNVSLASASLITSSNWQTKMTVGSDHLSIFISLQMAPPSTPSLHQNYVNLKKANWGRCSKDIEETMSTEPDPTDCQQGEKILRATILKAGSQHNPSGRHKLDHTEALPADIVDMMSACDNFRSRDPTSPAPPQMNDEINQAKNRHKRGKWRTFVETLDHKSASSRLWRTIKTLDGKSKQTAENEAFTFNDSQVSSPKQIANRFNEQFTTSKLGRHISSRETRLVFREVQRNSKETTVTFTTDLLTRAIRSCSNTKEFGPDKLSIFHLKH